MTLFWRPLCILILTSPALVACTPAIKEVMSKEWQAIKSFGYTDTAKQLSGWDEIFPAAPQTITENMYDTYCINSDIAGTRRMLVTGVEGDTTVGGGCILDAPVPYEPHRLINR